MEMRPYVRVFHPCYCLSLNQTRSAIMNKITELLEGQDVYYKSILEACNQDAVLNNKQAIRLLSSAMDAKLAGLQPKTQAFNSFVTTTATWINSCRN